MSASGKRARCTSRAVSGAAAVPVFDNWVTPAEAETGEASLMRAKGPRPAKDGEGRSSRAETWGRSAAFHNKAPRRPPARAELPKSLPIRSGLDEPPKQGTVTLPSFTA